MSLSLALIDAVLARLQLDRPLRPNLESLARIYRAWCGAVPFDNARKMIHVAAGHPGPLPGSTAEDFLRAWLADGAGGTCWAGNGALCDLLTAFGYQSQRVTATMMVQPDTPGPNHGSVLVTLPEGRFVVDASVLTAVPLRIPGRDQPASTDLPRLEWRPAHAGAGADGHAGGDAGGDAGAGGSGAGAGDDPTLVLVWRTQTHQLGLDCRIDQIGIGTGEWDALHQRTGVWSPFNYALSARLVRNRRTIGYGAGQRFAIDPDGQVETWPCAGPARTRFLIDELGVSPALAALVPPDREVPPPPQDFHPPTPSPAE